MPVVANVIRWDDASKQCQINMHKDGLNQGDKEQELEMVDMIIEPRPSIKYTGKPLPEWCGVSIIKYASLEVLKVTLTTLKLSDNVDYKKCIKIIFKDYSKFKDKRRRHSKDFDDFTNKLHNNFEE